MRVFDGSRDQVQLLAEDLAKPLRDKMGKFTYTEVLLNLCFMETVKATKVSVSLSQDSVSRTFILIISIAYLNASPMSLTMKWFQTDKHSGLSWKRVVIDAREKLGDCSEVWWLCYDFAS